MIALVLRALVKRGRTRSDGDPIPAYSSAYRLDGLDARHIARYQAAFGFSAGALPLTYYYLMAQRAHLATLLDERFPFAIVGAVHVENELVEHAVPAPELALELTTTVQVEAPTATGARYCVLQTVAEQHGRKIFTCRSRYLARRGQRKSATRIEDPCLHSVIGSWKLAARSGRAYAAISGDWNPIHLWQWSARLMGLPSPIIHGMHTLAKACATIESHAGQRITTVAARFTAPVTLGNEPALALSADGREFSVICHERVAVQGTLGFASTHPHNSQRQGSV